MLTIDIAVIIVYGTIFIIEHRRKKTWACTLLFTLLPYAVITFANNCFLQRIGFYKIEDAVSFVLLVSLIPLYLGVFCARIPLQKLANINLISKPQKSITEDSTFVIYLNGKIVGVKLMFLVACSLRTIELYFRFGLYGLPALLRSGFQEFALSGIISNFFLITIPLASIIFYHAIKHKSISSLFLYVFGMLIAAMSFIKYNVIYYVILTYVFCLVMDASLGKKLILLVSATVVGLFLANYLVVYFLSGDSISLRDLFIHLWKYIGGSIINGNWAVREFGRTSYTAGDLLLSSSTPLLNEFLNLLFGFSIKTKFLPLGFRLVCENGETSNVMGMLFVCLYTGSIILTFLYVFLSGYIIERVLIKCHQKCYDNNKLFYSLIFTVSLMSFFANYFELNSIWKMLIFSYIFPRIIWAGRVRLKISLKDYRRSF